MNTFKNIQKIVATIMVLLATHIHSFGADATAPAPAEPMISSQNIALYVLAAVIVLFVFIIFVMSNAIKVAGKSYSDKIKNARIESNKKLPLLIVFSLLSNSLFAQATETATKSNAFDNVDLYLLGTVVFLLFIVVLVLVRTLFILMGIKKTEEAMSLNPDGSPSRVRTWFQKFNETVPIEDEASLDMSHDYDGIRELDNKIPSWWTWAFFSFVLFGVVYLYRMFIAETLPDQFTELAKANEIAEVQKAAYLKKGANNVDETNVVMLSDAEIGEGAALYAKNCIACHGDKGQGGVGPNLTDDYWIHKGGIKDIFYSIKYGWQEKGMKPWKDDFSPSQIAQLSSFIRTLKGTNPPTPKEKQGELYTEEASAPATDSTIVTKTDTTTKK